FNLVQRAINDTLGNGFLAAFPHVVHELGQNLASAFWIIKHFALGCYTTSWHVISPQTVFRLARDSTTKMDARPYSYRLRKIETRYSAPAPITSDAWYRTSNDPAYGL